jgi:diguanylate cyclase (GGDEF)-like protein
MGLVLLGLATLLIYVLVYSANSMDRSAIERQRELADNALSVRLVQSLSELRSVAWWDEMVVKSTPATLDKDWLDVEVGVFVTTSYAHDRIIVLDGSGRPIYGFGSDARLDPTTQDHYAKLVAPLVAQVRGGTNRSPRIKEVSLTQSIREDSKITERSYGRGAAAVMSDNGKPVLASLMSITPSINMKLNNARPQLLVSIIDVNGAVLKDIGKSILMPDLSFAKPKDERQGRFNLVSDSGEALGSLVWTPRQPGRALFYNLMPLILIVLAATAGMIVYLFSKLVTSAHSLAGREAEARFLADHDVLTGLPNRRQLERLYQRHFANASPYGDPLAIACVDLDRFKDINDTLGHQAGDALICAVAVRLRSILATGDTLARLGGDEFAILRQVRSSATEAEFGNVIDACFAEPFDVTGHKIETGASMGINIAFSATPFAEAIRRADIALYDAKANGRARATLFTPEMAKRVEKRHAIESDLKRAIANRELSLAYQPIVEAATGAITSVEALLRWNSATHGQVSPDVFITVAEEAGLMAELGRFVIGQAVEDAKRWPGITTAINISPAQLRSATVVADLLGPAKRAGISPHMITIEITESVLMSSDERTMRVLRELKSHGFTLALDDFGTGYSSLAYLRDFPFDKLKIDRSFVKGLSVTDRALAVVEGVVNFGRILGREIVAEGIETEQEMQAMQRAGCTHLQGFLFSRPLPAEHIEALAATFGRPETLLKPKQVEAPQSAPIMPLRKRSR